MITATRGHAAVLCLLLAGPAAAGDPHIELLGQATVAGDLEVDDTLVGGLSGLTYDPVCDLFYAISDDKGRVAAPRFYTLRITLGDDGPEVRVLGATTLQHPDGTSYRPLQLDPEALALTSDGELYVAAEGMPFRGVPPEITRFGLNGWQRGSLPLPGHYVGGEDPARGVRENLGFEGVAVSPDGSRLFAAVENALVQDGPVADLDRPSPARLLVLEVPGGRVIAEHLYLVEPVPDRPRPSGAFATNGITELAALDNHSLLVVERAFSYGVGNSVGLYLVDLAGASDLGGMPGLLEHRGERPVPVSKRLVADLESLGVDPDNIEAMTLGPVLHDGRRMLVMISDNNFQPAVQETQVVVAAISGLGPPPLHRLQPTIPDIQGDGHVSPLVGRCVENVGGVVTAVLGRRRGQAFWVQDPQGDGDPATSDGLLVTAEDGLPEVDVGDRIRVSGRVEERSWGFELPVTRLFADRIAIDEGPGELPQPVVIGIGGREVPQPGIAAPGFTEIDPGRYAADFFESLEGMLVAVEDPVVVGPTSRNGEFVVLADGGRGAEARTRRGGLRRLPHNPNPQRIIVDDGMAGRAPRAMVGDRLDGRVEGVLHATYGSYKVLNTAALPAVAGGAPARERTLLRGDEQHLTIATFNLENLSAVSGDEALAERAAIIVDNLGAPDVLALQEVQDDSGPEDDGTVSAGRTLKRLLAAIEAAGGPRYRAISIDPVNGADGGQPGANIRNVLLVDPKRVGAVDRGGCTARQEAEVVEGPALSCSPGVLGPRHWAFRPRDDGSGGSRKPLVAELRFSGRSIFVVNLHLVAKGGDDPLFGRRQPRQTGSGVRRLGQAEVVAAFVHEILERDPRARIVVLGDLNDFPESDAMAALEAVALRNLMGQLPPDDRYSYVYLGNSQVLDHVLVSPALAPAAEIDAVHVNAEYPFAERASDHDPVVARLEVAPSAGASP